MLKQKIQADVDERAYKRDEAARERQFRLDSQQEAGRQQLAQQAASAQQAATAQKAQMDFLAMVLALKGTQPGAAD